MRTNAATPSQPLAALQHHVSGAIARGEAEAIAGIPSDSQPLSQPSEPAPAAVAATPSALVWRQESGLRGEGITFRSRVLDEGDTNADGTRAVAIRVWHIKGKGIELHLQPCRYSAAEGATMESESHMMFSVEPRERVGRVLLATTARRNDKITAAVTAKLSPHIFKLASAWLVHPDCHDSREALAALKAAVAVLN